MADQMAPEVHVSGEAPEAAERADFVAPAVQDLGRLQALTQQLISVPLPP